MYLLLELGMNWTMALPWLKIQLTDLLGIFSANFSSKALTAGISSGGTQFVPHLESLISQLPEVSIMTSKPKPNWFFSMNSAFHNYELFWS